MAEATIAAGAFQHVTTMGVKGEQATSRLFVGANPKCHTCLWAFEGRITLRVASANKGMFAMVHDSRGKNEGNVGTLTTGASGFPT